MRKSLAFLLAAVMLLALPGCGISAAGQQAAAPASAEPYPTPAEPSPTPAEPSPTPAEPSPAPAEPSPTPAEATPTPAETTPAPVEESNPLVRLVYDEGVAFLQNGQPAEAYADFFAAADAGSADAMQALARGVILDKTLAGAAAGDEANLLQVCRARAEAGDPWGLWAAGFLCMNGMGTGIRYEDAYRFFEQAAQSDNDEVCGLALYEMGYMLANGFYERDSERALQLYREAADLGNAYAMGNLTLSYVDGSLTERDDAAALDWFRKALKAADPNARTWLLSLINQQGSSCLFPLDGSAPDYERGKQYYDLLADEKDENGLYYLGVIYAQGWGVERDTVKAVGYFKQAMDLDSARAAYNLAVLYTYGDDEIRRNLDKGLEYFCRAAELGYEGTPDLMNDIGVKILNGDGFAQDPALAMTWYEKAGEAGSTYALNNLGYLHTYHPLKDIPQDLDVGLACYSRSAELGDENALNNIYTTAVSLLQGKNGLKKDPAAALTWFRAAGQCSHVPSMYMLGCLYSDPAYKSVVEPNLQRAAQWFGHAADAGDFASMEKLADLYAADSEVRDLEKALQRYGEAADACPPENAKELAIIAARINNLGVACSDPASDSYDPDLAFAAYTKAAELGDNSARTNLAKAYAVGLGTEVNMARANQLLDESGYKANRDSFFADKTWVKAKA